MIKDTIRAHFKNVKGERENAEKVSVKASSPTTDKATSSRSSSQKLKVKGNSNKVSVKAPSPKTAKATTFRSSCLILEVKGDRSKFDIEKLKATFSKMDEQVKVEPYNIHDWLITFS